MLRQGAGTPANQMLQEFVFPSGRRCRTFDELVQGCYNEWEEARELLYTGTFGSFLAATGRADLKRVADEAKAQADRDMGLTNFINQLPAAQVQGPKLNLTPRRMVVGPLHIGEQQRVQLKITNEGRGLLQGKLTVAEGADWLRILEGDDRASCPIKASREQAIPILADMAKLVADQNYTGKLVVVTNGGVAEVIVRLNLLVRPFARAPFAGARTPRDLARMFREKPHDAVNMFTTGDVQRWFASNGWDYPVVGPPAPGLAAVQQFFEALGLAKPPVLGISTPEFRLACTPSQPIEHQVTIKAGADKIVYGRADSDAPWLKVLTPNVCGQMKTDISFRIEPALMPEDRQYQGTVRIIANGNQTLNVRVFVEMRGNPPRPKSQSSSGPMPILTPLPSSPQANAPAPVAPSWLAAKPHPAPVQVIEQIRPAPSAPVQPIPTTPFKPAPQSGAYQPATYQPAAPLPEVIPLEPAGTGGLVRSILVGAVVCLVLRLVLIFPGDIYARLLGTMKPPDRGSLQQWLQEPAADEGFLRMFVLATWWIGAITGAILVRQRGGRWADLGFGVIAGSVAGAAGSATVGCLLVLGDALPRELLRIVLGDQQMGPGGAVPLWLLTALTLWTLLGAGVGFVLGVFGRAGAAVLSLWAGPLAWLLRLCGMGKLAQFFVLQGG